MIPYCPVTRTKKNIEALRASGWRMLLTPDNPNCPEGFRYAIDNGAWKAHQAKSEFDEEAFLSLYDKRHLDADFVVIPDIVAGGRRSFDFSAKWIYKLRGSRLLFAVQDGMNKREVVSLLEAHHDLGLFLGGSTEYKLSMMYDWGAIAAMMDRWFHVGRVNSRRRIRLCEEAGATSFDGSSVTRFSKNVAILTPQIAYRSLFSPRNGA